MPLGLGLVRYRTPVLSSAETRTHPHCVRVVWPYAPDGTGALPDDRVSAALERFESRLVAAWESDHLAVLAAVLTFDGARQWAFYTSDVPRCAERLSGLPEDSAAYPIEIDAFADPDWAYLRSDLLAQVPFEA
jgi:Family of unknown function (DUF695)